MSCKSGEVTLYQDNTTNAATKMWWDFGDGAVKEIDPSVQTTVHVYDSSKIYKAYLIAENGDCTVKDSVTISVLQRQHPVPHPLLKYVAVAILISTSAGWRKTRLYPTAISAITVFTDGCMPMEQQPLLTSQGNPVIL